MFCDVRCKLSPSNSTHNHTRQEKNRHETIKRFIKTEKKKHTYASRWKNLINCLILSPYQSMEKVNRTPIADFIFWSVKSLRLLIVQSAL